MSSFPETDPRNYVLGLALETQEVSSFRKFLGCCSRFHWALPTPRLDTRAHALVQAFEGLVGKIFEMGAYPMVAGLCPHGACGSEQSPIWKRTNDRLKLETRACVCVCVCTMCVWA